MALSSVRVTDLFDTLDHRIDLRTSDRITILHGANGLGKTTVLRMIHMALRRRFVPLKRIPFRTLELCFDAKTVVTIRREMHVEDGPPQPVLFASLHVGRRKVVADALVGDIRPSRPPFPVAILDDLPWLRVRA